MSAGPRLGRLTALCVVLAAVASAMSAAPASAVSASPASALSAAPTPASAEAALPAPVSEFSVPNAACGVAGVLNKLVGVACGALSNGGALIKGGKQLITGHVGGAVKTVLGAGSGSVPAAASTALGLAAIGAWVVGGAGAVLHEAAAALGATTTPQLESSWFSATYWRMAAIAAMLTLPFLFAATVQAALRSDVSLLARAALGYLPLAMVSIAIAAPLTTLLLAASDELSGLISSAAGHESAHLLAYAGVVVGGLSLALRSPFLAFLLGLLAVGAAFTLWIELLLREAAVYVVVLMLPLAFAAMAWPARRVWAVRAVELLVALILSKFVIVAVLSLGGAALSGSRGHSVAGAMAGTVLIMLAVMSPWALVRLVPLAEIASGAAGALRGELHSASTAAKDKPVGHANAGAEWVGATTAAMRRDAQSVGHVAVSEPAARERPAEGPDLSAAADPPPPQPAGSGTPDEATPTPRDPSWSERSVLELGPNAGETPVWPHPEAE